MFSYSDINWMLLNVACIFSFVSMMGYSAYFVWGIKLSWNAWRSVVNLGFHLVWLYNFLDGFSKSCPNRLRLWPKTLATDELATQWAKPVWLYALCHCFGVIDPPSLVFFMKIYGTKLEPLLTSMGNPIVEIRRSYDCLISTMGFPILVRRHLSIESGLRCHIHALLY